MDVRLLYSTPDPERAVAAAARLCYAPVGGAQLFEGMSEDAERSVLRTIMRSGHHSALEHATYTFAIEGVSRALTHQLVRHRLASYNQQSQRYVAYADEPTFVVPPGIAADAEALERFNAATAAAFSAYRELTECGVEAEDARYVLPNAMETKIVVTMNMRELLHFLRGAVLQARSMGDPRTRAGHARAREPNGALRLRGRGRAVSSWAVPGGRDDLRRPLSERTRP